MYCMHIPFTQVHALLAALLASLHDAPARGRLRRCSTHGAIGGTRDERQFENPTQPPNDTLLLKLGSGVGEKNHRLLHVV
jgi:hypothetical protein